MLKQRKSFLTRVPTRAPLLVAALAAGVIIAATAQAQAADAISVSLGDGEISIAAGTAGTYGLSYPLLRDSKSNDFSKPSRINRAADGSQTTLTYPNGEAAVVSLADHRKLHLVFRQLPAGGSSFRMEMLVPITFAQGGSYAVGDQPLHAFSPVKPTNAFLFKGQAGRIRFVHPSGTEFTITGPADYSFQQLQDNRVWNWSTFHWLVFTDLPSGQAEPSADMTIEGTADASQRHVLIDRYGQFTAASFPTKITADDQLTGDVARDAAYYATFKPPATDSYGGMPGSGDEYKLTKTGFFHTAKAGPADVLVTPEGNAFFQTGVCGVIPLDDYTLVKGRESIYEWIPERNGQFKSAYSPNKGDGVMSFYLANVIRKYGKPFEFDEYAGRWMDRLRAVGFNSAGAWSFGSGGIAATKHFANSAFLPIDAGKIGTIGSTGVWDAYAEGVESKLDAAFAADLPGRASDPLIIGFFSANEPALEDVPKLVPSLKATSGAKQALVKLLRHRYADVAAFNTAWHADVPSLDALADLPLAVTTEAAGHDVNDFFRAFLDRRYTLIDKTFHKYDTNHLLLGDRWTPGTAANRAIVEAAGPHLDVISVNYYAYTIDREFLGRIHGWAGNKPMLLSEFHFTCTDQGTPTGGMSVETQADRGMAYRGYVENAAATGYVVGIQWFEGLDQAPTGRWFQGFNGESANTGLVNVADRPYVDFLAAASQGNADVYPVLLGKQKPFIPADPRLAGAAGARRQSIAIPELVKPFQTDGGHSEFAGVPPQQITADRLVLGTKAKQPFEATYRIGWDDHDLCLYVDVIDATPMNNNQPAGGIWSGDAIELFIGAGDVDEGGSLKMGDRHILLRAAQSTADRPPAEIDGHPELSGSVRTIVVPSSDGRGYTFKAAIPLDALGFKPSAGTKIRFDIGVDDSTDGSRRERQLMWNGSDRNSRDRSGWGSAEFVR